VEQLELPWTGNRVWRLPAKRGWSWGWSRSTRTRTWSPCRCSRSCCWSIRRLERVKSNHIKVNFQFLSIDMWHLSKSHLQYDDSMMTFTWNNKITVGCDKSSMLTRIPIVTASPNFILTTVLTLKRETLFQLFWKHYDYFHKFFLLWRQQNNVNRKIIEIVYFYMNMFYLWGPTNLPSAVLAQWCLARLGRR